MLFIYFILIMIIILSYKYGSTVLGSHNFSSIKIKEQKQGSAETEKQIKLWLDKYGKRVNTYFEIKYGTSDLEKVQDIISKKLNLNEFEFKFMTGEEQEIWRQKNNRMLKY